ncbi:MAG: ATP-binding protein, partial [Pseudomonadota bacterium]
SDLCAMVQAVCAKHGANAHLQITGVPRHLALRPVLATRALENVIGNAIKYGDTAHVHLTFQHRQALIRIEDEGPGIAAPYRAAALRPFVRLDPARGQNTPGTGLGLAIADDAIKQHGGHILLEDSPKHGGLMVTLKLPYTHHDIGRPW